MAKKKERVPKLPPTDELPNLNWGAFYISIVRNVGSATALRQMGIVQGLGHGKREFKNGRKKA